MNARAERLEERVRARSARVGVIGLGYVGLPLALALAEAGFRVLGFDTDPAKVALLERGESYLDSIEAARIAPLRAQEKLRATADPGRLGEPDVIVICVPTPLDQKREPDLRFVVSAASDIAKCLREGQLILLESTTFPGTTEEILVPMLEESGLKAGEDFFVAYSPEREDPGNRRFGVTSTPKVVGGLDPVSSRIAASFYGSIAPEIVSVSSPSVAEAGKLTENVFRSVNIALVNELKVIFDGLGIDVWEVLDSAATKPFGFMRFDPGPGWGGHCIPIDPFYLSWRARQAGVEARFIELAGEINTLMPRFVVSKLETALAERGETLAEARILLVGLAYKKNVADPRESPSFDLMDLIARKGASFDYHDPMIPSAPPMRTWPELPHLDSKPLDAKMLSSYSAVVIVTDHDSIDYDLIAKHARLIVDARGRFRGRAENVVPA